MDRDNEFDLARGVAKRYEALNLIVMMFTIRYLFQHAKDINAWVGFMLTNRLAFKKSLQKQIDKNLNKVIKAQKWAYDKESEEWNKLLNEKGKIEEMDYKTEIDFIRNKAIQSYDNVVSDIAQKIGTEIPLTSSGIEIQPLYKVIQQSIAKNVPTYVRYTNGRRVPYRVYIEMKLRTDMSHKSTDKILDNEEIELYQCSYFYDSADDHREAQGKVYCKAKFHSKYPNLTTVEEITGAPVYLTTRPNCRHTLTPIKSLSDAVDYKKRTNKDEASAYKKREHERRLENEIRQLDLSIQILESELPYAKGEDLGRIKAQIENNKSRRARLNSKWQDLISDSRDLFEYYNL